MSDSMPDLEFYRQAALLMTSSLDMSETLIRTFEFLRHQFPIEGISLHQLDAVLQGHRLFFLVTRNAFHHVERFLPLSASDVDTMLSLERDGGVFNYTNEPMRSVSKHHSKAIADMLPYKRRAYLVGILRVAGKLLGHLVFLGTAPNCFTADHARKLDLLLPLFSVVMSNMLQFQQTMDFQRTLDKQKAALEEEVLQLRGHNLVGVCGGLKSVMTMINQLAGSETPVLIQGETGTGKEMIADAIQRVSPRRNAPFIKVNCGAIPESLVDSELFGHQKGAFTGAVSSRAGRFEQASGGTLFLDEVGELPPQVQVRLLRVLQNRVVERLGGAAPIAVDVRIISATNRHLETMLRNGTFREDLYYRLNVFPIHIPPLRDRKEDIPALVMYFIKQYCARMQRKQTPRLRPETLQRLMAYSWPGNVRELENLVERALIIDPHRVVELESFLPQGSGWYLSGEGGQDHFEKSIAHMVAQEVDRILGVRPAELPCSPAAEKSVSFRPLDEVMAEHIRCALQYCEGKIHGPGGAGEVLGVNPNTLRKKMAKLGISLPRKRCNE